MPQALSPRDPAPRLRSTVKEQYGTPRTTQSRFQQVALGRGYTIKAGRARREGLENNRGRIPRPLESFEPTIDNLPTNNSEMDQTND